MIRLRPINPAPRIRLTHLLFSVIISLRYMVFTLKMYTKTVIAMKGTMMMKL